MANPWFRMYAEFLNDPKVQMMSEANQRRFIMLLCMRCSNDDVTLHDDEIAFQLRISNDEWSATKAVFLAKNLIDENNSPSSWDKRQFASDSSAERVARHRAKRSNGDVTLQKRNDNALDTDTDTDISTTNVVLVSSQKLPTCPHQEIIELFANKLPELPQPRIWEGQRQKNLSARWSWVLTAKNKDGNPYATDKESAIDFFARLFVYVSKSDFLMGRSSSWQCDLGWLVKAENFAKVISGNYDNKEVA